MISISRIHASNALITADTVPRIAVVVGGTAGIGKATLSLLVSKKTLIKIYVIGRDAAKMKHFLDQLRQSNDQAEIIELKGQVSSLADTKRLCDRIKSQGNSIDLLFLSADAIPIAGRQDTSEGIESSLSLIYYSPIVFTLELLRLLNASPNNPRIVSIFSAGSESASLQLGDMQLAKPGHFTIDNSMVAGATYNLLALPKLADENPKVVFIHNHPGFVQTDLVNKGMAGKWYSPVVSKIIPVVMRIVGHSEEFAGERSLYLITSATYGGKRVALGPGDVAGLTLKKTESGGLFEVGDAFECLHLDKVVKRRMRRGLFGSKLFKLLKGWSAMLIDSMLSYSKVH